MLLLNNIRNYAIEFFSSGNNFTFALLSSELIGNQLLHVEKIFNLKIILKHYIIHLLLFTQLYGIFWLCIFFSQAFDLKTTDILWKFSSAHPEGKNGAKEFRLTEGDIKEDKSN